MLQNRHNAARLERRRCTRRSAGEPSKRVCEVHKIKTLMESNGLNPGPTLFDAATIVAGSMIGSGIFIVSADIVGQLGSAAGLLMVWLVSGLMTIAGALAYGELAAMMPHAGGQYVFLREAYGGVWAFSFGWTLLLVIQTGTIAAGAVAFGRFRRAMCPLPRSHFLFPPRTLASLR